MQAREKGGPFTSLFELCERIDLRGVNKRVLESLIQAGAMDSLPGHRAQLMAAVPRAMEYAQGVQRDRERGQTSLFQVGQTSAIPHPQLPNVPEWHINELLAREKALLGNLEERFNVGLVFPGTNQVRSDPRAEQQVERTDQDRLSSSCFTGQDVESVLKLNLDMVDDRQIRYFQEP